LALKLWFTVNICTRPNVTPTGHVRPGCVRPRVVLSLCHSIELRQDWMSAWGRQGKVSEGDSEGCGGALGFQHSELGVNVADMLNEGKI
jgi:hypothetical protein